MEEFKKRIQDMVEDIEKRKEIFEKYRRRLTDIKEHKQTAMLHDPPYRSDQKILAFVFVIAGYYAILKDPNLILKGGQAR